MIEHQSWSLQRRALLTGFAVLGAGVVIGCDRVISS